MAADKNLRRLHVNFFLFQRSIFHEQVYLVGENRFCFKDVTSLVDFCRLNRVNDLPGFLTEHPPVRKWPDPETGTGTGNRNRILKSGTNRKSSHSEVLNHITIPIKIVNPRQSIVWFLLLLMDPLKFRFNWSSNLLCSLFHQTKPTHSFVTSTQIIKLSSYCTNSCFLPPRREVLSPSLPCQLFLDVQMSSCLSWYSDGLFNILRTDQLVECYFSLK